MMLAHSPGAVTGLAPVSVDELNARAALQTRLDRKYIVTLYQLGEAIRAIEEGTRALEIDRVRSFRYESVYFDTSALDAYLLAAHRRPDRFKVRWRNYIDSGRSAVEVKLRNRRGQTVKHRLDCTSRELLEMPQAARDFASGFDTVRAFAPLLRPTLTTRYSREHPSSCRRRSRHDRLRCRRGGARRPHGRPPRRRNCRNQN